MGRSALSECVGGVCLRTESQQSKQTKQTQQAVKSPSFISQRGNRQIKKKRLLEVKVQVSMMPPLVLLLVLSVRADAHSCPGSCSRCSEKQDCELCRAGWMLHINTCVDVDECESKPPVCPDDSFCVNTDGSFRCKGCDPACVGCVGGGAARCRRCSPGFRLTGSRCSDVDECSEMVLACSGLDEICTNTPGSFQCDCASAFHRRDGVCVRKHQSAEEKGLFEDLLEEEVQVLQQMFWLVVLCALAALAAKGDLVYTSVLIGALAAVGGFWLSDRGDRVLNHFLR